ncbi:MAG: hypothetical protein ACJA09_000516 [Alcanivorax sp.]|jgi:hypothetical protein
MTRTLSLLGLIIAFSASAQVYRTTDENGNAIFTDSPQHGDSEQITINPTNTTPATKVRAATTGAESRLDQETAAVADYRVKVTAPEEGSTIPMGTGSFMVIASVSPSLEDGETLQLLMNGTANGEPQNQNSWNLVNVRRGEHSITVARYDADGNVQASSEAVHVLVLRPIGRR